MRVNFSRRGLVRAMRAAPADRVSSPGYFTMVRWRVRSFVKPRMFLEKESCQQEMTIECEEKTRRKKLTSWKEGLCAQVRSRCRMRGQEEMSDRRRLPLSYIE